MKAKELRDMSLEDLRKKEKDLREDLFKLQFQHGIRRLENPDRLAQLRKDIARVKTVMNEMARS
ncbi:50S ribosomal protein L29 [Desulfolithobacter dissulfuricans]|uniref:Large ribosomal subunit protein uL29 n=1 Tax=Desulfolithobacter dissulfuricans TaxID=2795293 RepID=A0A915U268_9BACT|nr:50S ribosomal protein L29 [Desulfolithobacter dissulfuricans]BCO09963.1 50S ribosomal protein L29 [Desulfolithobacter dissulfuricans]